MAAQADVIAGRIKVEETVDAARVRGAMSAVDATK